MIMVPAENLYKQYLLGGGGSGSGDSFYGGCCGSYAESLGVMSRINGYEYNGEACLGSDLAANPMAEDDSRTNSLNEAVSSSKDHIQEEKDDGWLQLSIGSHASGSNNKNHEADPTAVRSGGLVELDLFSGDSASQLAVRPPLGPAFHVPEFRSPPRPAMPSSSTTSLFFHQNQQPGSSLMFPPHNQDISWPLIRPITHSMATAASSSSSSSLIPLGWRPTFHQVQTGMDVMAAGPSSVGIRIIDPPRRPHSGIWFMLQASQNQVKEPFLPQIPKSYLRIKDGKMTVRLLMKYLVNKLRLDSESEVEITCRGQHLQPFLTLQHVRDNIWSTRDAVTLLPESSSPSDHVMVLNYGRSAS
ncbi:hypothetical protein SLEP1_g9496 [Rubroshorea leprosula]|uniref:Uncharacterized protein n=1 Tax=Rubroshorea leprosula TaxID=152421 RepID=A0AAV5IDI4_9ROSI|nr:hypothetical protein SLEP1_g9496 [Rubroshorea leprosula]